METTIKWPKLSYLGGVVLDLIVGIAMLFS